MSKRSDFIEKAVLDLAAGYAPHGGLPGVTHPELKFVEAAKSLADALGLEADPAHDLELAKAAKKIHLNRGNSGGADQATHEINRLQKQLDDEKAAAAKAAPPAED